jgi:adenine-specific DNA-methyltransferase
MQYISQQFSNRVINGDCVSVLQDLPAEAVDFVLTDPPYLVNYRSRDGRSIANDASAGWLKPAFEQIYRVLKQDSYCVSFYGWNRVDQFFSAWKTAGFRPAGHLVWVKSYASSSGLLSYRHEQAYLLVKGEVTRPTPPLPDVLEWHYTGNRLHPTQKPVRSLKPVIGAFTKPGDIVLDPFCGSGSTLLAAKILGRRYIGIDLDPQFCQTARERL